MSEMMDLGPDPVPAEDEVAPRQLGSIDEETLLAGNLFTSQPRKLTRWQRIGGRTSFAVHTVLVLLIVFVPIFRPAQLPDQGRDPIAVLLYDPPPPPPPPLPKGSAMQEEPEEPEPPKPVVETPAEEPEFTAPIEPETPVDVAELLPEDAASADDQFGSESGSEFGVADGMDVGIEGGVVGGIPGGVLGGVLGGTGTGPVLDYDAPPRPIKITKPQYPQEAFVKKVEGVVTVEILIDSTGRVVRARVIQSIPMLDAAALQTVYQWLFQPAVKNGRPVPTIAHAPVTFRIY
jgi:protein TonB